VTSRRRLLWTSLAIVLLAFRLAAQSGGSVLPELAGSTRSAGLGGAGVALIGDAGALFANPAGIAAVRHVAVEASLEPYLAGSTYSTAAVALHAGHIAWGFGAQALDYGSEPLIVPDSSAGGRRGIPTGGTFTAADLLGTAGVVYRRGFLALGGAMKYARMQIGDWSADAWGGDVGLAVAVFDIAALGVSVQNLGGDFGASGQGARLPRRTRAGLTMNYVDPQGTYRLLTTVEGQWPAGASARLATGVEGGVVAHGVGLVGRVGFVTRSPTSAASRWSVGGGVELRRLHVDYAYQAFDLVGGGTHRFGIRWAP
jgi:hypothetical protein